MGNGVFEVLDAPFDKALLLFGSVVLGVLTQVTMGARFRDRPLIRGQTSRDKVFRVG